MRILVTLFVFWVVVGVPSSYARTIHSVLKENFKMVLSSNQSGPIILYVQEGSTIRKGEKLFGVEPDELEMKKQLALLELQQAHIRLEKVTNPKTRDEIIKAKLTFQQYELQYNSGAISKDAFELAKMEFVLATQKSRSEDISLAEMEIQLKELRLKEADFALQKVITLAPAQGRINKILVQPNEWVKPGKEVLELINIHPLYAFMYLPITHLKQIKKKKSLKLTILTGNRKIKIKGLIKHIYDEVDAVSQTIRVRIEVNNAKLRYKPGMRVQITLP